MLDHSPKAHSYSLADGKTKGILTKGSFLLKCLAAYCVINGVGAAPAARDPFPTPSPTCGCSDEVVALHEEIGAMKVAHAAEIEAVHQKLEEIYQFVGMTPPSTPPSPPPSTPPSPPPPSPSSPPPSPSPTPPSPSPPPPSPSPSPPPPSPFPPTPPPSPSPPPPPPSPPFKQCSGAAHLYPNPADVECPSATPHRYPDNHYGANNRCFETVWGGAACNVDPQNDPYEHQRNDVQCNCYSPPPSPSPTPWFDSSSHCSTAAMRSFGWTVSATTGSGCDGGHYHFWEYPNVGYISIPLPTDFSVFTIEYGQSCGGPSASVQIKLNNVVVDSIDGTCGTDKCYVYPPPAGCLKTISMAYNPGDVLRVQESGIGYIKTISLAT